MDVLVGLNEDGELRVLVSTDGDSDAHTIAMYPIRRKRKAVDVNWEG